MLAPAGCDSVMVDCDIYCLPREGEVMAAFLGCRREVMAFASVQRNGKPKAGQNPLTWQRRHSLCATSPDRPNWHTGRLIVVLWQRACGVELDAVLLCSHHSLGHTAVDESPLHSHCGHEEFDEHGLHTHRRVPARGQVLMPVVRVAAQVVQAFIDVLAEPADTLAPPGAECVVAVGLAVATDTEIVAVAGELEPPVDRSLAVGRVQVECRSQCRAFLRRLDQVDLRLDQPPQRTRSLFRPRAARQRWCYAVDQRA